MRTSTIRVEDLQGVFAVPPLARTSDPSRALDFDQNNLIVRHIASGGITRLIYGGNAFLYRIRMIINRVGDRLYWIGGAGEDLVPAYYSIGIRTFTSSIATVAPRLSLKLHELACGNCRDELEQLMNRCVIPLYAMRARRKGYEVSTMKTLMDMAGLCGGAVRPPLVNVKDEEREELSEILTTWKEFLD